MFFERPLDSKPVLVNSWRRALLSWPSDLHVRFPGKAGAQGVALCHRRLERLAMMCSFCPFSRRSEGEIVGGNLACVFVCAPGPVLCATIPERRSVIKTASSIGKSNFSPCPGSALL